MKLWRPSVISMLGFAEALFTLILLLMLCGLVVPAGARISGEFFMASAAVLSLVGAMMMWAWRRSVRKLK